MLGLSPKSLTTGFKLPVSLIKRSKSDLIVRRATREPIISQGPVGRQAWNGQTATVFGCTGFLGRYVVSALATQGTRVIIPYRGISENTRHLKPSGDLGMVIPMEFDIRNRTQVEEVMRHSDVVINLIGRNYETKNFTLEMVNIDAPARIAEIAQNVGVARFIHVSSLCADPNSKSAVY
ncbi:NADH-ubiquinone oxidoreductase 40 kDa subunit, mitochondrial, partial [Smittium culicis]